jgi:hypothetical protein
VKFNPRFQPSDEGGRETGDLIVWLQDWCLLNCDETPNRSSGIRIETIPDGGWTITVDLRGTKLEYIGRDEDWQKLQGDSESDWIHFKVSDGRFEGRCGPRNLKATLDLFRAFASSQD